MGMRNDYKKKAELHLGSAGTSKELDLSLLGDFLLNFRQRIFQFLQKKPLPTKKMFSQEGFYQLGLPVKLSHTTGVFPGYAGAKNRGKPDYIDGNVSEFVVNQNLEVRSS